MAISRVIVAFSMLCLVFGDDGIVPGPPFPSSGTSTTTVAPSPPKPTDTPSTSTTTTTTTTPKPETTTAATNTTSTSTTTTAAPNTTTTATTTTKPTITTIKPTTPAPVDPVQGKWIANYTGTNKTCIVLEAAIQIDVTYTEDNKTKTYPLNVPPTAEARGTCDDKVDGPEIILLSFDRINLVTFNFTKNNSKYDLQSVVVAVNLTFTNGSSQVIVLSHEKHEFSTPVSRSYKCEKEQSLNLSSSFPDIYVGQLRVSHLQMQAFRHATNTKFDEALDCEGYETPDVVPIAVGCALAALVIIVLVAYLIGRRRSQARGYLSM